jgi:tetratricopeptide (TPR) repeat protein
VVSIYAYDKKERLIGQGAGFFVSSRGELVTNFRALRRAHKVLVKTSSGETLSVRGMTAQSDKFELIKLLVKVGAPTFGLPLADRLPEKGQQVVVFGGHSATGREATRGWVSAVRDVPGFGPLLQITAPGASLKNGGPVVDFEGRVVGVVSVFQEAQEVFIAVPGNRVKQMDDYSYVVSMAAWSMGTPSAATTVSLYVDGTDYFQVEPSQRLWGEPQEILARGVEAYFSGRYEEAVLLIRGALKFYPDNADARYTLGMAYEALGRWPEALAAYRETIRLDPTYAIAHHSMGLAYAGLERWEDAVKAYNEAIRLSPDYAEAYANLGSAYRKLGRWSEASSAYQKAVRLRPDFAEAHFRLGIVYEKLERTGDAIGAFEETVKFRPDFAAAHSSLGALYVKLGRPEEGVEAFREALRLEPGDAEALSYLGAVYGQLGRYQEEVRTLEEAVRYGPFYWKARSNLGVAYWRGGRTHDALVEFQRSLRLKPDDSMAHFYLGLIYLALGNKGGAMQQYRALAKLDREKASKLFLLIGGEASIPAS